MTEEAPKPIPFPEPGIYPHIPEEYYHRIPALSKSLVKKFGISPIDAYEAVFGEEKEATDALKYGSAFHAFLLEGPEELAKRYCSDFDASQYPDALKTSDDLKAVLKKADLPISGNKPALLSRVRAHDPTLVILDDLKAEHQAQSKNKTPIKIDDWKEIQSREWIRELPDLKGEGHNEISFFWFDESMGCNCKARLDRITFETETARILDLKTFTNTKDKNIHKCVTYETGLRKYHIDAFFYQRALTNTPRVFHECATEPDWPDFKFTEFHLLYVEKGRPLPNVLPIELATSFMGELNEFGQLALTAIRSAAIDYIYWNEKRGSKPWNAVHKARQLDESEIPPYLL